MNIQQKYGLRVKTLRESKNITQKDLSFLSDLDRSYITSVENGQRNISIKNIEKISNALSISIRDFFNYENFNEITDSIK